MYSMPTTGSQDIVLGTAITIRAGRSIVRILVEARDFFFSKTSISALGPTKIPKQCILGSLTGCKGART